MVVDLNDDEVDDEVETPTETELSPPLKKHVANNLAMKIAAARDAAELIRKRTSSSWQIIVRLVKLNGREWPLIAGGSIAGMQMRLYLILIGLLKMPIFSDTQWGYSAIFCHIIWGFLWCKHKLLCVFETHLCKLFQILEIPDNEAVKNRAVIYGIYFVILGLLAGGASFLQTYLLSRSGVLLTARLRKMVFQAILRQEMAWFDAAENSVGSLTLRLSGDCANVQAATGSRAGSLIQSLSMLIFGFLVSLYYSWNLTLVVSTSVPLVMVALMVIICMDLLFHLWFKKANKHSPNNIDRLTLAIQKKVWWQRRQLSRRYYSINYDKTTNTTLLSLPFQRLAILLWRQFQTFVQWPDYASRDLLLQNTMLI